MINGNRKQQTPSIWDSMEYGELRWVINNVDRSSDRKNNFQTPFRKFKFSKTYAQIQLLWQYICNREYFPTVTWKESFFFLCNTDFFKKTCKIKPQNLAVMVFFFFMARLTVLKISFKIFYWMPLKVIGFF